MKIINYLKYYLGQSVRRVIVYKYRMAGVTIADNVFVSHRAEIDTSYPGLIIIETGVYITSGAKILAHDHAAFRLFKDDDSKGKVHIKKNVFIGVNAVVLRNVTIGENAIVAAGAIVTTDVPSNTIVAGNPAKVVRTFVPVTDNVWAKNGFRYSKL
jgi:acetyltransferase-like isoleucine patch superfamily enzyme